MQSVIQRHVSIRVADARNIKQRHNWISITQRRVNRAAAIHWRRVSGEVDIQWQPLSTVTAKS